MSTLTPPTLPNHSDNLGLPESQVQSAFGRYKILKELGRGGMGVVYHAYDTQLSRHVALKVMAQAISQEKDLKRFEREAHLMGKLNHPNIVQIFDVGQEQGRCFFTMELVDGQNLGAILQEHPSLHKAVAMFLPAIQAVHYAHTQGIIHRDLKPSNIMVNNQNVPKVMDFGLAKEIGGRNQRLSRTQDILGTPEYMSPEQASGKLREVDARSDVYSLGGILYEIMVGKPPFSTGNPLQLLYQIAFTDPVPPSHFSPRISVELEAICLKALEKDKSKRYQTALALADDLAQYLQGKPVAAKPITSWQRAAKWVRRNRMLAALSALLIIISIALVGLLFHQERNKAIQAKQIADKETKLRQEVEKLYLAADEKTKTAQSKLSQVLLQEAQALNDAARAIQSQAMSELMLAKVYIGEQKYEEVRQKQKLAHDLLQAVAEKLQGQRHIQDLTIQKEAAQIQNQQVVFQKVLSALDYVLAPYPSQTQEVSLESICRQSDFEHLVARLETPAHSLWLIPSQPSWNYMALANYRTMQTILWDIGNSKPLRTFDILVAKFALAFSPNEQWVAMGDKNGRILVAETTANRQYEIKLEGEGPGKSNELYRLMFSPDGKWLAAVSGDRYLLWEFPSMQKKLQYDTGKHFACAFSPDGKWLAIGSAICPVLFFLGDQIQKTTDFPYTGAPFALCFASNTRLVMGDKNELCLLPVGKDALKGVLSLVNAHQGMIRSLAVSPEGDYLASVGEDGVLAVWSLERYTKIFEVSLGGRLQEFTALRFHPTERRLGVWTGADFHIYRWEKNRQKSLPLKRRQDLPKALVDLLRMAEAQKERIVPNRRDEGVSLALDPGGKYLAIRILHLLYLWNLDTGLTPLALANPNEMFRSQMLTTNHDGTVIMNFVIPNANTFDTNPKLLAWRANKPQQKPFVREIPELTLFPPGTDLFQTCQIQGNQRTVQWCKISPDLTIENPYAPIHLTMAHLTVSAIHRDQTLAAIIGDQQLKVWQLNGYQPSLLCDTRLVDHEQQPLAANRSLCFADASCLAMLTEKGELTIFDWRNNRLVHKVRFYDPIKQIAYDPQTQLYWIHALNGIYLYPHLGDAALLAQLDQIFPLPVYRGHPILAADISRDFRHLALFLQTNELLYLQTK